MDRTARPTDAAKAIIDLVHSARGQRVRTAGGSKHNDDRKDRKDRRAVKTKKRRHAPERKTRQQIADEDALGTDDPPVIVTPPEPADFRNPMLARGDIIIGGLNGAPIRLPMGLEGQVLGIRNGQLTWVDVVEVGGSPNYYTYFDGVTDVELTYYDGVTDFDLWL